MFKNLFNRAQNAREKCWDSHIFLNFSTEVCTFDNTTLYKAISYYGKLLKKSMKILSYQINLIWHKGEYMSKFHLWIWNDHFNIQKYLKAC